MGACPAPLAWVVISASVQFEQYPNYPNTMETSHLPAWEFPVDDPLDVRIIPLPEDKTQLAFAMCELRCKVSRLPAFFVKNIFVLIAGGSGSGLGVCVGESV